MFLVLHNVFQRGSLGTLMSIRWMLIKFKLPKKRFLSAWRKSHRLWEGWSFDPHLGFRNRFSEGRAWRTSSAHPGDINTWDGVRHSPQNLPLGRVFVMLFLSVTTPCVITVYKHTKPFYISLVIPSSAATYLALKRTKFVYQDIHDLQSAEYYSKANMDNVQVVNIHENQPAKCSSNKRLNSFLENTVFIPLNALWNKPNLQDISCPFLFGMVSEGRPLSFLTPKL